MTYSRTNHAASPRAEERRPVERVIRVSAGLFVLRHAAAGSHGPATLVTAHPPDAEDGWLVAPPGMDGFTLVAPGDGLVILALRDFSLMLTLRGERDAAEPLLTLDPVSSVLRPALGAGADGGTQGDGWRGPALPPRRAEPVLIPPFLARRGGEAAADPEGDLVIRGHLARRGDVMARAGEWLGGPDDPAAIEGLELSWPGHPRGVDIAVRLTVNDHGPCRLPEVGLGRFAGTRRRAAPIIALDLQIDGRRAEDWTLVCSVLFEGQHPVNMRGTRVALRGRSGREPLVGLKLMVMPVSAQPDVPAPALADRAAGPGRPDLLLADAQGAARQDRQALQPAGLPGIPQVSATSHGRNGSKVKVFRSTA